MKEKWIPCDDYLPECGRYVPITLANGALFVGKVELVKGTYKWVFGHDNVFDLKVMAWLDIKPYEVEQCAKQ